MKVLTIFTCFNRKEKTIACIESLKRNDAEIAVIAVDDNSNDGTALALEKYPNVEVIQGNGNLYYSGGMRMGFAAAAQKDLSKFDYVMLMNDDVLFYEHAIDKLISFEAGAGLIAVGATCDDKGNLSYGGVVQTSRFRPKFQNVISEKGERTLCDTFCANCVLIPASIFKEHHTMDQVYQHAMGDYDYGFALRKAGNQIVASDFFVGICNDNDPKGSWRDISLSRKERLRKKESVKGLPFYIYFYYLRKNHGFVQAIVYSLIPYIRILIRK